MPKRKTNEIALEQRAKNILRYLRSDLRYDENAIPRPFFIELTGSPSSGKTTVITELDKFLRREGFRVLRPQEGAEVIRHIERTTPVYNLRTGLYALTLLLDISAGHLYDVVIFDRSLFDAYVWMMYWREKDKLSQQQMVDYQAFFLSPLWVYKIDAAVFMLCDSQEAMRRELRIALSSKLGETTNPKTIETLVSRYKRAFEVLSPNYSQLCLFDTTNLEEGDMVEKIVMHIFDMLEEKTKSMP